MATFGGMIIYTGENGETVRLYRNDALGFFVEFVPSQARMISVHRDSPDDVARCTVEIEDGKYLEGRIDDEAFDQWFTAPADSGSNRLSQFVATNDPRDPGR